MTKRGLCHTLSEINRGSKSLPQIGAGPRRLVEQFEKVAGNLAVLIAGNIGIGGRDFRFLIQPLDR